MTTPSPSLSHRLSLPEEPGRRAATWSLLMVAGTVLAALVAGVLGTVLQLAVLDLQEGDLLKEAGAWGVVAAVGLLALMAAPGIAGAALGVRARRLGERRLGTIGLLVNAVVTAWILVTGTITLLLG